VALSATHSGSLTSLLRHRFKSDRFLQSPSRISNGLNAGHEALQILHDTAQGEPKSIIRLSSLLESTLKLSESNEAYRNALRSTSAPASSGLISKAKRVRSSFDNSPLSRTPESRPILERPLPLPEIESGKRRVPRFVSVQGMSFLHYSKPQSSSLSRVLRQKIAWEASKWGQRKKLSEEIIPLGENEDAWDDLVALQEEREAVADESSKRGDYQDNADIDSTSWNAAARIAEAGIAHDIKKYDQRNLETGRRMFEILKQERVLAANEKAVLRSRKYRRHSKSRANEGLVAAPDT
jgi:hypothetical protein